MWYDAILQSAKGFRFVNGIYSNGDHEATDYLKVSLKEGGTDFFSRTQIPGTHSFFDTKIIYRHIAKMAEGKQLSCVADFGCGDGRMVSWFLKNTDANIVAIDGSFESLRRLQQNHLAGHPQYAQRVLLVHTNILNVPLIDECCDLLWSFEVLCYLLNDFEKGLAEAARLIKKGGFWAGGERIKEFGLLHELLNRGINGFLDAARSSDVLDDWNESIVKGKLVEPDEFKMMLKRTGIECVRETGISFFPVILSFLRGRKMINEAQMTAENINRLSDVFSEFSSQGHLYRSFVYLGEKK